MESNEIPTLYEITMRLLHEYYSVHPYTLEEGRKYLLLTDTGMLIDLGRLQIKKQLPFPGVQLEGNPAGRIRYMRLRFQHLPEELREIDEYNKNVNLEEYEDEHNDGYVFLTNFEKYKIVPNSEDTRRIAAIAGRQRISAMYSSSARGRKLKKTKKAKKAKEAKKTKKTKKSKNKKTI